MKKRIVLVDPDPRSQKVLEVSLVQAGYAVYTADDGDSAWALLAEDAPDLVITDTRLAKLDGYALVRKMRAKPNIAAVPVVFITSQRGVEDKIRGLELGVEEFLTKPVYANELLARVSVIFSRITSRALAAAAPVSVDMGSGKLSDIGLFDLMLTFESARRTGALHIEAERGPATLWFRDGRVVDAECGALRGPDAVYRCFVFREGRFKLDLDAVPREETITDSADTIVTDATRRLKEWQRVTEQLPELNTVFDVDHQALLERLPEIPDEINGILRLIDGARSVWTIIDQSPFDDLSTMSTLAKLYFEGLLKPKDESAKEVHAPTAPHGTLPPVEIKRMESAAPQPTTEAQNTPATRKVRGSDAPPSRTIVPFAVPPPQHPPVAGAHVATASAPPRSVPGAESAPPLVGVGPAFPVKEETKDYQTVPRAGSTPPSGGAPANEDWKNQTIVQGSSADVAALNAITAALSDQTIASRSKPPQVEDDDAEHRTLKMKNPVSDDLAETPDTVTMTAARAAADSKSPPANSVPPMVDNAEATTVDAPRAVSASSPGVSERPAENVTSARPPAASDPGLVADAIATIPSETVAALSDTSASAVSDDAWRASEANTSSAPPSSIEASSVEHSSPSTSSTSLPPMVDDDIVPPVRRIPGKYVAIPLALMLPIIAYALVVSRKEVRGEHDTAAGLGIEPTSSVTAANTTEPASTMGAAVSTITATTVGTTAPAATVSATAELTPTAATTASAASTTTVRAATTASVATGEPHVAPTATAAPVAMIAETNPVAAAQQYLEKGNTRKAVELAERATRNNPSDAEAWLTLGGAYQIMGANGRARAAYKRCAESASGGRVSECKALLGNE